jgi:membrane-bound lytic murein transglycosylase D
MAALLRLRGAWMSALLGPLALATPALAEGALGKGELAGATKNAEPAPNQTKAKPKPREKGSAPGKPDDAVRRILTGEHPEQSSAEPRESPELATMRALDRELFPPTQAPPGSPWDTVLVLPKNGPSIDASGVPKSPPSAPKAEASREQQDLSWLTKLKKPDIPVRYEPSVVRYLLHYKNDERGQRLLQAYVRKSGRYRTKIAAALKKRNLPEDLLWLAMVESSYDATIHSHAGAAGLWQFMPATGRIYGLTVNRRVDERLDPERSTEAALQHLSDLHKRFGNWELAFAAYNMGYGGLLASVRRFNTNDYWELRRLEAGLPYETALYVPKIMALAIAAKNCDVFACDAVTPEAPLPFGDEGADAVSVAPGVTLDEVAEAIGEKPEVVASLNPHVIGSRMPPLEQASTARTAWTVYVPRGKRDKAAEALPAIAARRKLGTHQVRWGEPIGVVAASFATSVGYLEALNDLHPHESPRPGTTIFVPPGRKPRPFAEVARALGPVAVVPDHGFSYADRRRVFFEPIFGDTLADVARICGVSAGEVSRWNHLDPAASLQEGMRLQLFLPNDRRPDGVVLFEEGSVQVVTVESQAFFDHAVGGRGRERIVVTASEGDTWTSIGKRYGVSLGELERINHKSRRSKLEPGDKVVVYAKRAEVAATPDGDAPANRPNAAETPAEAAVPTGETASLPGETVPEVAQR